MNSTTRCRGEDRSAPRFRRREPERSMTNPVERGRRLESTNAGPYTVRGRGSDGVGYCQSVSGMGAVEFFLCFSVFFQRR